MNYIYPSVGIILAFAWCIFLLNEQRDEIISLKAQLSIEKDYNKDIEVDINTCKGDVDYLKAGLEQVISASKRM